MEKTSSMITKILMNQDHRLLYAHKNPRIDIPFEGPDGKIYEIDPEEVAAIKHTDENSFEIDKSLAWQFSDENGNIFDLYDAEDGSLALVSCTNSSNEVIIPAEVNGKTVTAIAFAAFANCKGLTALECSPNITKIHPNAFKNCTTLEKLILPQKSNFINRAWFKALKQLRYLVLPDNLVSISSKVFVSVDLNYLYIGAKTTDIDAGAFNFSTIGNLEISPENTALSTDGKCIFKNGNSTLIAYYGNDKHYNIPNGCTEIYSNAFAYNKSLRTIGMPDSLETIEAYAFSNSMLEEFIAPKNLREIQEKAFYFCANMNHVVLNEKLITIGKEAFFKAPINELYIPASVTDIHLHAFYNTDAAMAEIDEQQFGIRMESGNSSLFIDEMGGLYKYAAEGLIFLEMLSLKMREYTVHPKTIEIADSAFIRHPFIETVNLPEGLKRIGDAVFRGCKSLSKVNFPESLKEIGKEAFVETVIKEAYLPKGLESLGEMALRSSGKGFTHWLPGLKDLKIHPENDRFFIEDGVLYQRKDGTTYAWQYIGPNENVRIPHECTHIMPYTFAGISNVRKLFLPSSIEHIGYSGFMFEDAAEEIVIELKEPYGNHKTVTAYFSRETVSNQCIRKAFSSTRLDIPDIFMYSDRAIIHTHNFYTRARLSIERLMDPVYSTPGNIDLFQRIFEKDLLRVCREFAHHDFAKGFDYLIKLGYITSDNMTKIIDEVSETNDVAMIGYLLELKHRHFKSSVSLDLDL